MIRAEVRGTVSVTIDLRPVEFAGMPYQQVIDDIRGTLEAMHPNVAFSDDDIAVVAADICRGTY